MQYTLHALLFTRSRTHYTCKITRGRCIWLACLSTTPVKTVSQRRVLRTKPTISATRAIHFVAVSLKFSQVGSTANAAGHGASNVIAGEVRNDDARSVANRFWYCSIQRTGIYIKDLQIGQIANRCGQWTNKAAIVKHAKSHEGRGTLTSNKPRSAGMS